MYFLRLLRLSRLCDRRESLLLYDDQETRSITVIVLVVVVFQEIFVGCVRDRWFGGTDGVASQSDKVHASPAMSSEKKEGNKDCD